ncbi:MAG: sigma-70 family RNA polymerase sigma factor [Vicinamibacterales bacterium]|nr:sigma-70 family RNA polymerase sigma factor [Vicinamibacterales bacterium]
MGSLPVNSPLHARSLDDADLVQRMLDGDEAAFAVVVDRYHAPLTRFARLFVRSHSVAEEVVQDTWVAVLNGLPAFEGRSTLKSWIFSILANRAKTRGVRERRVIPFADLGPAGAENGGAGDGERFTESEVWATPPDRWGDETPETLLLGRETGLVVQAAVDALPAVQRAVVTLRDIEGLGAAEVCNVLELSETNQRVLLHRARTKVRKALGDYLSGRGPRAARLAG